MIIHMPLNNLIKMIFGISADAVGNSGDTVVTVPPEFTAVRVLITLYSRADYPSTYTEVVNHYSDWREYPEYMRVELHVVLLC